MPSATTSAPPTPPLLFAGIAQVTAVTGADAALRDRYVAVMLDGLRPAAATALPGKPLQYRDLDKLLRDKTARR